MISPSVYVGLAAFTLCMAVVAYAPPESLRRDDEATDWGAAVPLGMLIATVAGAAYHLASSARSSSSDVAFATPLYSY